MLKHIKEFEEFHGSQINEDVSDMWETFKRKIVDLFSKDEPEKSPNKILGPEVKAKSDDLLLGDHMIYLPHQQGPAGTAELINVIRGKTKLTQSLRSKLLGNMPSLDKRYATVKSGKDIEAAKAFIEYQKETWDIYKKEALSKIKQPQNANIKKALEKIPNRNLPFDFLATVAYKESRFNPNPPTNKSYRGLFQIGDLAWKQLKINFPEKYKGEKAPLDPFKNAQAGHDNLSNAFRMFDKKITA